MKQFSVLFIFVLLSCSSSKTEHSISDTFWIASEINKLKTLDSEVFFEILDNKISGKSGCNQFFGNCKIDANTIRIEEIGATRMICQDMNIEEEFLNALSVCTNFSIDNDSLYLYDPNGTVLAKFIRQ